VVGGRWKRRCPLRVSKLKPRLPKALDSHPRAEDLLRGLVLEASPLWEGGEHSASCVEVGEDLVAALRSAVQSARVIRGFEAAETKLAAEERGLKLAPVGAHPGTTMSVDAAPAGDTSRPDDATPTSRDAAPARNVRISRLLLLANDGSPRFYRNVDGLLRRHGPRLFALRLDLDALTLGSLLYGPDRLTRLLLIEHKDAVAAILLAVATQWERRGRETP
jgi:hypothetical protein